MKYLIMFIWMVLTIVSMGCSPYYYATEAVNGTDGKDGADGHDGLSVVFKTLTVTSSCTNGGHTIMMANDTNRNGILDSLDANIKSSEVCNGLNGSNGQDGANGNNGTNGHDGTDGTNGVDGHDGTNGSNGSNGSNGTDGINGVDGHNGHDGTNGTNGHDGIDAVTNPYSPVDLVSFCGNIGLSWGEVGLRLSSGVIIASFSDNAAGANTRWVIVKPGNYHTTDGYNCNFTVNANGTITH